MLCGAVLYYDKCWQPPTLIKKVNGNLENYESWDSNTFKWKSNNRSWFSWLTPPLNSITILFFVLAFGPCFLKYILSRISQNQTFFFMFFNSKKKKKKAQFLYIFLKNPSSQTGRNSFLPLVKRNNIWRIQLQPYSANKTNFLIAVLVEVSSFLPP